MRKLINQYLEDRLRSGSSKTSVKNYKSDLTTWHKFQFKNKVNFTQVNNLHLKEYIIHLEEQNYSQNTTRRKIQTLRLFLDHLAKENIIQKNDLPLMGSFFKEENSPLTVTNSDITTLWKYLSEESFTRNIHKATLAQRNLLIVLFCFENALLVSEMINLKISDISLSQCQIVIESNSALKPKKRTLQLSYIAIKILTSYIINLKQLYINPKSLFLGANQYKFLKSSMSARSIELMYKKMNDLLNIHLSARTLRHSGILYWLQQGIPHTKIKNDLGLSKNYNINRYVEIQCENIYSSSFFSAIYFNFSLLDNKNNKNKTQGIHNEKLS